MVLHALLPKAREESARTLNADFQRRSASVVAERRTAAAHTAQCMAREPRDGFEDRADRGRLRTHG